ncbi:hypothetical protein M378DRAFT_159189 [Amanita muscaria Koide BX008]|uniref:Uncharacterized protein n=1 Tax=Amanita muscaria (strain Koide BX008) TaxID=946122 RepID=A0A0C2XEV9_AMAMK|nr:hypothetical protein M378DRAFT_159189 [Amanita muscaria Koide BX008]
MMALTLVRTPMTFMGALNDRATLRYKCSMMTCLRSDSNGWVLSYVVVCGRFFSQERAVLTIEHCKNLEGNRSRIEGDL